MSSVDPSKVSSNWKILQAKLKAEKTNKSSTTKSPVQSKGKPSSTGLKRKSVNELAAPSAKKGRISKDTSKFKRNGGSSSSNKMGFALSKPAAAPSAQDRLAKNFDISLDLSAAYGSKSDQPHDPATTPVSSSAAAADIPNIGLHPTHQPGKFLALDCEMVGTGAAPSFSDHVLARASITNYHGAQIYDSYVQAPRHIRVYDYRTPVSGITAAHMSAANGARTFAQVQKDVVALLEGRILVGHAVKNDLDVLQIQHPRPLVRDTSRLAKYRTASKGKPPALRKLVKEELGWEIQRGQHSSLEDARATMALFRKERAAFEEEARRRWGNKAGLVGVGKGNGKAKSRSQALSDDGGDGVDESADEDELVDEDDEEEDDIDLLEGEEDELDAMRAMTNGAKPGAGGANKKKKKSKKKKRTKRA